MRVSDTTLKVIAGAGVIFASTGALFLREPEHMADATQMLFRLWIPLSLVLVGFAMLIGVLFILTNRK